MFRFEEPTHAAQVTHGELPAEFGRSGSELASESMAEMRMTEKPRSSASIVRSGLPSARCSNAWRNRKCVSCRWRLRPVSRRKIRASCFRARHKRCGHASSTRSDCPPRRRHYKKLTTRWAGLSEFRKSRASKASPAATTPFFLAKPLTMRSAASTTIGAVTA
jgi:hypothetical protein